MHQPTQKSSIKKAFISLIPLWFNSSLPISSISTITLLFLFCNSAVGIKPATANELVTDNHQGDKSVAEVPANPTEISLEKHPSEPVSHQDIANALTDATSSTEDAVVNNTTEPVADINKAVADVKTDDGSAALAQVLRASKTQPQKPFEGKTDVKAVSLSPSSRLPVAASFVKSPNLSVAETTTNTITRPPVFASVGVEENTTNTVSRPPVFSSATVVETSTNTLTRPPVASFATVAEKVRNTLSRPPVTSSVTTSLAVQPVTNTTADLVSGRSVNSSQLLGEQVKITQQPSENTQTPSATNAIAPARAVGVPEVQFQGVYILQGEDDAARARVTGTYAFSPYTLIGATVDLTTGSGLSDSRETGLNINELYLAASPPNLQNLRFVVGQMDLTSYFDRNSFAKDGATHFFNPVFQTNPALSATGISSRPGALVNWAITDDIEAKAAVFSSSRNLGNFALDAFAGEVAARFGNAIVRATYASNRDAGSRDGFEEIFQIDRGNNRFGVRSGDREESYGLNGEYFIPSLKMGVFGRYGRYENQAVNKGGDTYSFGVNFLDLFQRHDRLGLGYGRQLSNSDLRDRAGKKTPDVLELFYDFRVSPNLRLGFTLQGRDEFSETVLGFRVKTEFDISSAIRRVLK